MRFFQLTIGFCSLWRLSCKSVFPVRPNLKISHTTLSLHRSNRTPKQHVLSSQVALESLSRTKATKKQTWLYQIMLYRVSLINGFSLKTVSHYGLRGRVAQRQAPHMTSMLQTAKGSGAEHVKESSSACERNLPIC